MSEWPIDTQTLISRQAELGVIGWLTLNRSERRKVTDVIGVDDLGLEDSKRLFRALEQATEALEPVELAARARVAIDAVSEARRLAPIFIASAVRVVTECSVRRALRIGSIEVRALAQDLGTPVGDALEVSQQVIGRVEIGGTPPEMPPDVVTFAGEAETPPDWLIPGALERGDRIMITAGEGVGKSTFLRQFAMCAAAGLHPFTFERIEPLRCLIIDLESGDRLVRRKLRELWLTARHVPGFDAERVRVEVRPEGVDLTARSGRAWLTGLLEVCKPDLVAIGPLYKAYIGDMREEESARHVAALIDELRNRHGTAWLIETHAPHGEAGGRRALRPFGSSLWLRWPELGVGFRMNGGQSVNVEWWRLPRDRRDWPSKFKKGGRWPWTPM